MAQATENVVDMINNEEISPQTRLNAIRTLLEYSIKFTENVDILPRIETLEKMKDADKN